METKSEFAWAIIGIFFVIIYLVMLNGFHNKCEAKGGFVVDGGFLQCIKDGEAVKL